DAAVCCFRSPRRPPRPPRSPYTTLFRSAAKLGVAPVRFELRFDPVRDLGAELVESLLRRYSVSLFRNRAVVLLDIVAFSTYTPIDRKSTRLNSSHVTISYAVLCFKKKNE